MSIFLSKGYLTMKHCTIETAPPGSIISVPIQVGPFTFDHVGILGDYAAWGEERVVYSNSRRRGRGTVESVSTFAAGEELTLVRLPPRGRGTEIVLRARRLAANTTHWSVWNNCEHFTTVAYGEPASSPQLQNAVAGLGAGAVAVFGLSAIFVSAK